MAVTARNGFIFQSIKNYGNADHKTEYPNLSKEREDNIKRKKDCTLKGFKIFFFFFLGEKMVQINMYADLLLFGLR